MKQLKIVSDNYDSLNGLITVNFNEPIIVVPNSKIAMDKFSMQVSNGVTDAIELGAQTVYINTNTNEPNANQRRGALVPSGSYTTVSTLLMTLNQSFNAILNSNMTFTANPTPDNGLFFYNWLNTTIGKTEGFVTLGYGSGAIDYTDANLSLNNMTFDGVYPNSVLNITAPGIFTAITIPPVVRGALDCRFQIDYSENTESFTFEYGLFNTNSNQIIYGIKKSANEFNIYNNGSIIPVDLAPYIVLHPGYMHQFYVEGGDLFYQIVNFPNTIIYTTPRGAFDGFNFNTTYDFAFGGYHYDTDDSTLSFTNLGITYQPNINQDTFGIHWDYSSFISPTYLKLNALTGTPPLRTVEYDFEEASTLQFGLGFQSTVFESGVGGAVTATAVADVLPSFEEFYDLALQIPSLQLESYIAKTGGSGSRINNLCYFFPILTGDTNKIYYTYENRELAFVNLSNKQTINMNSMQFRVVFVANNLPLIADAVSFNLYIDEPPSL